MKSKKSLGRLAIMTMAAPMLFSLVACGGGNSSAEKSDAPVEEKSSVVENNAKSFVFEAEHTNLANWAGAGFSNNPTGVMAICPDKYNAKASNGYFICDCYKNGCYVVFNVEASDDIEGVKLIASLTAEKGIASLSEKEFAVGYYPAGEETTYLSYGELKFDGVKPDWKESGLRPFSEFDLGKVSLKKGLNYVLMAVNNDKALGGTANASAPLIDCIKMEIAKDSPVEITMEKNAKSLKQIEKLEDL